MLKRILLGICLAGFVVLGINSGYGTVYAAEAEKESEDVSGDCADEQSDVLAKDTFTVEITLANTSKTDGIKNMMITAAPDENIELLSKSDSIFIEELQTGKTCQVSYEIRVKAATAQGHYSIPLMMDYADSKGNTYTAQGMVKVMVGQMVKLGVDPIVFPKEIQMGETIELQTQVMNLGRGTLKNVRTVVEADGLNEKKNEEPQDDTSQWWIMMAVILLLIIAAILIMVIRKCKDSQVKEEEES